LFRSSAGFGLGWQPDTKFDRREAGAHAAKGVDRIARKLGKVGGDGKPFAHVNEPRPILVNADVIASTAAIYIRQGRVSVARRKSPMGIAYATLRAASRAECPEGRIVGPQCLLHCHVRNPSGAPRGRPPRPLSRGIHGIGGA